MPNLRWNESLIFLQFSFHVVSVEKSRQTKRWFYLPYLRNPAKDTSPEELQCGLSHYRLLLLLHPLIVVSKSVSKTLGKTYTVLNCFKSLLSRHREVPWAWLWNQPKKYTGRVCQGKIPYGPISCSVYTLFSIFHILIKWPALKTLWSKYFLAIESDSFNDLLSCIFNLNLHSLVPI